MKLANIKVDVNIQTVFEGRTVDLTVMIGGRRMSFRQVRVTQSDDRLFLSDGERVVILNWKYVEVIVEEKSNDG